MTLAVGLILAAMAVPAVRSSVQYFRVRSAVSSITGAICAEQLRAAVVSLHHGTDQRLEFRDADDDHSADELV